MNPWRHICVILCFQFHLGQALWQEFGRIQAFKEPLWSRNRVPRADRSIVQSVQERSNAKKAAIQKQMDTMERLLSTLDEVLDESEERDLFEMSFSLSLSDGVGSMIPTARHTTAPTSLTVNTATPTAPTSLAINTATPTAWTPSSSIPSDYPSLAPTGVSDMPSAVDVDPNTLTPTLFDENATDSPTVNPFVFDCDDNVNGGLSLGFETDEGATLISLTVGYKAESTSSSMEVYIRELESQLLKTAILAVLGGCDSNLRGRRHQLEREDAFADPYHRHLMADSVQVGICEATFNETESCTVVETDLIFFVMGVIDPDVAAYRAYTSIEDHMIYDRYIGIVPTVLLLEYLSPLPLPPPPSTSSPGDGSGAGGGANDLGTGVLTSSAAAADRLEVSAWTIGACVATIMGGVISLLVYSRNRQDHQRRHLQLTQARSSAVAERRARNPITI